MSFLKYFMIGCCIGFGYDFHYVQYGGVIAAHVLFMMIQISSSGYKLKRNKITYPIMDFLFIIFCLGKSYHIFSIHWNRTYFRSWSYPTYFKIGNYCILNYIWNDSYPSFTDFPRFY